MAYNKKEYSKKYYQMHRQELLDRQRKYHKEHKEERNNYCKIYYAENKDVLKNKMKKWYDTNKEHHKNKQNVYYTTEIGRANTLANSYKTADKENGRGEGDIDGKWIIENIFSKSCVYCGEDNWTKLGCDRIDNSKPHTKDNVVCCCGECNKERQNQPHIYFLLKKKGYFD
jgi:hypothetical protein